MNSVLQRRRTQKQILRSRRRHLGRNLSLSYSKPLLILRGKGQYVYDQKGVAYLDCVNNVSHVGHCHPSVVRAGQQQMELLNTNTRYLHPYLVEYAEALTGSLPGPLSVCFFVNSGSEANDLALRMARTHTGQQDVVVVDHAYHGHTGDLIDISPYKFRGQGGRGTPASTHVLSMPDRFRGKFRGPDMVERLLDEIDQVLNDLRKSGRGVAAFFAESVIGCGGQIVLPDRYLRKVFARVRKAGGVCVADEVQIGFGRVGSHMWAFETQEAVPDILTLGKPMGNGHPLGAVVTSAEIADSFANGMEYFNTYGGNPVSCAIGLAVLDVLRRENLQEKAARIGNFLQTELSKLMNRHPIIGDVRGLGLFLGIELVKSRLTLEPAAREANRLVEMMKSRHILLSRDGPDQNVIKIKPPMVFTQDDAETLIRNLDQVLSALE